MSVIYRGGRDPWKSTALYEVWKEMMRTARRQWRQSLRDKTGDDFPVDPVFREFYKFRLWACFNKYRAGESDGWALVRKNGHEPFSPENCYFAPHPPARGDSEPGITRGASKCRCAWKNKDAANGEERKERKRYWGGASRTRLYSIWYHAVQRCTCKDDRKHWPDYGGRGITICDAWRDDFLAFRDWAWEHGYAPDLTLERIDTNGNYCPENCRWAGAVEQHLNTREYRGMYKNLRLTAADALSVLTRIPGTVVVTLCVRSEHLPDDLPPETDFGPVPVEGRIDAIIKRDRRKA